MSLVMTDGPIEFEPQRIADEVGEAGGLLRDAKQAFLADLSESRAFRQLERRRVRAGRIRTFAAVATVAVAAGGATAWFHQAAFRNTSSAQAEPLPADASAFTAEPEEEIPVSAPRAAAPSATEVKAERTSNRSRTVPSVSAVSSSPRVVPNEAECQAEYKARAFQRAADCFRSRTSGNDLAAEVATYRAARIHAESLGDPRGALLLLDEHRRRFPNGAMRGEVELLRVRSLNQSGRYDEALAASETLLGTPTGRALSSQLHLLRGQIFQDRRQDCAAAASEFVALMGEPGRLGDEAELRRAECLEKLGRATDARLAYQHYLRRDNPISADKARQRLGSLEGGSSDQGGVQ
jgi:hypothetical protein